MQKNLYTFQLILKRTTTYEVERIDSKVIDLNEYEENQELLDLTFYDRKAVAFWSQEVINNNELNLTVNGLQDLVCQNHSFSQLLHDAIKLAFNNDITCVHVPMNGEKGLHGQIRNEDLYHAYPYPDKPMDMTVNGQNIKDMLEYSYSHLDFVDEQLSLTIIDETLCTMWQGFNYAIDMSRDPGHRVELENINLEKTYRITMTDYCFRNYKNYLKDAIVHESYEDTMSTLIAEKLKDPDYSIKCKENFIVRK